jgi:hypothetical protein
MDYKQQEVLDAYKIYSVLASAGSCATQEIRAYKTDDKIAELVDQFAAIDDAAIITTSDKVYLVPIATTSPFHITNESIKKLYLANSTTNLDIYLMYVTIIILLGEFYNSYQNQDPTLDFITMEQWLEAVNTRLDALGQLDKELLKKVEEEQEYNWTKILEKWSPIDDIKEKAKRQSGNTISRMSFLNTVKNFLESQDMIEDIGDDQFNITEKTKVIVQRYYMDYEYNRGILEFIYQFTEK